MRPEIEALIDNDKYVAPERRTLQYNRAVEWAARLIDEQEYGLDAAQRAHAAATGKTVLKEWAAEWDLKRSYGIICLNRLFGKRCGNHRGLFRCEPHSPPGVDHPSMWNRHGKPIFYVSQPYGPLSLDWLKDTVCVCEEFGLDVDISCTQSWHFPGKTLLVVYSRKGTMSNLWEERRRLRRSWKL